MTNFDIHLKYPNEHNRMVLTKFTVKFGKISLKDNKCSVSFKCLLPKECYEALKGKKFKFGFGYNDFTKRFTKTVSDSSLEGLTSKMNDYFTAYQIIKDADGAEKNKKIFILFNSENGINDSRWNGAKLGFNNMSSLKYFVGFQSKHGVYDIDYTQVNTGYDKEWKTPITIDWTEERELFFERTRERLLQVNQMIGEKIRSINNDNIDVLIENGIKLLN